MFGLFIRPAQPYFIRTLTVITNFVLFFLVPVAFFDNMARLLLR